MGWDWREEGGKRDREAGDMVRERGVERGGSGEKEGRGDGWERGREG